MYKLQDEDFSAKVSVPEITYNRIDPESTGKVDTDIFDLKFD